MEFRHLRYFVAIAETLNFSRAAARLHVTQPALSRQIRDLEEELEQSLFDRMNNGVRLTAAGRELLAGARPLLEANQELLTRMRQRRATLPLRIAHFGTLSAQYFSPYLRRLSRKFPAVNLQAEEYIPGEALEAVRRGSLDAAFIGPVAPAQLRGLKACVVWVEPHAVLLAADHRLAKRRRVTLHDLKDEAWGIWNEVTFPGFGRACITACRRAGFRTKVASVVDDLASLFIHVAHDKYVSYAPPFASQLPHAGVVFLRTEPADAITIAVQLVWQPKSPHADALAWLAETMGAGLTSPARRAAQES